MHTWPDFLFVYGTLLGNSGHPMGAHLRRHATSHGIGSIQARLYIIEEVDAEGLNAYPGAVPSAEVKDRVHGEVYQIQNCAALFPVFNRFEACSPDWPEPYEFLLRPVDVTMADGEVLRAASYLYTWDTSRATLVPNGRFDRVLPAAR